MSDETIAELVRALGREPLWGDGAYSYREEYLDPLNDHYGAGRPIAGHLTEPPVPRMCPPCD